MAELSVCPLSERHIFDWMAYCKAVLAGLKQRLAAALQSNQGGGILQANCCLPVCMQRAVLDFVALTQGCVCSLRPAIANLTKNPPRPRLCNSKDVVVLPATLVVLMGISASIALYLRTQDWYHEGTSSGYKVLLSLSFGGVACISNGLAQHGDS